MQTVDPAEAMREDLEQHISDALCVSLTGVAGVDDRLARAGVPLALP